MTYLSCTKIAGRQGVLSHFLKTLATSTMSSSSSSSSSSPSSPPPKRTKAAEVVEEVGGLAPPDAGRKFSIQDIFDAKKRLSGVPGLRVTPVITCGALDKIAGLELYLKCENLQKTGSFKARGAANAVLKAREEHKRDGKPFPGVVTHSSGNHAQALAWAASLPPSSDCTVVVPGGTPLAKKRAIEGYGANLVECEPNPVARVETCKRISEETGSIIISSCDHHDVMAGQGTMGLELHEQVRLEAIDFVIHFQGLKVPDLDAVLVTCAGGGMAAGVSVATRHLRGSKCKVILVEPKGKELGPCLKSKRRLWSDPPKFVDTIAEGIRVQQLGKLTFPVVCEHAEQDVITVTDEEIVSAMRLLAERAKLVAEASAGAAVAAAIKMRRARPEEWGEMRKVGVIICGGNLDVDKIPW